MQFNEGARLDASQVENGGGGGKMVLGGGVGIIVLILSLLFGVNPNEIMGGAQQAPSDPSIDVSACQTGADIKTNEKCRFVAYANSTNAYWTQVLGQNYQPANTVLYNGQTQTACGAATSDVGPFYCPNDQKVYIDPSFTQDMIIGQLGGQGGEAAEAYVIGHEYGHHIQNLTGTLAQVQQSGNQSGAGSAQVALELQADCYAGTYLKHVTALPNSPISGITQDDLNRMVNAAQIVGDDYIQRKSSGTVNPDAWTHGSSQMRQHWLAVGFNSGDPRQCNTFGNN